MWKHAPNVLQHAPRASSTLPWHVK